MPNGKPDEYHVLTSGGSSGWRMSRHARAKITSRAFSESDVLRAVTDPFIIRTQENYGPNRQLRVRDHVAVVVEAHRQIIITVLLRSHEHWTDDDARGRVMPS